MSTTRASALVNACIAAAVLALAGCATTGGSAPAERTSGFDGARVVSIAPHGAACASLPCISVGAEWNSKMPDAALLVVTVSGSKYTGISRVEISIDEAKPTGRAASGVTRFEMTTPPVRESTQVFGIGLAELRGIASARRAWVRVYTVDGYLEEAIVDGQRDSKALHAIRRFLAKIDGAG